MIILYICLGVFGGILILLFAFLLMVYLGTFYTPQKGQNNDYFLTEATTKAFDRDKIVAMIDSLKAIPYEDAYITSFDKLKLHAKIYKNQNSDSFCVMAHGYRGTSNRDFSGGAVDMIARGYNVILIDERGHGSSQGHSITFGVREQKDVLSWIEYGKQTFGQDKKVILVGISMGAATVLMASDRVEEGTKIIADCPYTTPKEIISETMKNHLHLNPKIFWPFTNLALIIFAHTSLNNCDAKEAIKKAKAKILIIHGDSDSLVPYKFSLKAYEENKDKIQYELFAGAEHGLSYLADKERYQKVVSNILNQ